MNVKRVRQKDPTMDQPASDAPVLRFTPTAWAKLLFLRDAGDTEVGGFGVCPNHPLIVEDVQLVRQQCSWATVEFDDESVADYFEQQVDSGLRPEQFARIWIHTHPGNSALPSGTDEATFARVFGHADWAVMFILACGGETYARGWARNRGQSVRLSTHVDFTLPCPASDFEGWQAEYDSLVSEALSSRYFEDDFLLPGDDELGWRESPSDLFQLPEDDDYLQFYMEEANRDDHDINCQFLA